MLRAILVLSALTAGEVVAANVPTIRLASSGKSVEVIGLDAADLTALAQLAPDADPRPKVFAVFVDKSDRTLPSILGSWQIDGKLLRFEPRFPLVPGVPYRAVFDPSALPGRGGKTVEAKLTLPKPEAKATTVVEQVYPTTNRLPENQLKFYLHFSAPMERGDSYHFIQLLNVDGKPVVQPFLEIDQELWDVEGKRLTLFIDPGRIKRGLKPREDLGPVLEEGKNYTLVLDRGWTDADGNPLKATYRKTFTVGPPVEKVLDAKDWKLQVPDAGTPTPLTIVFPKPLDHALLQRIVWVEDERGRRVAGRVTVKDEEKRWQFTPSAAWTAGAYRLVADTRLEDLAGNNLARPFEVDVFRPVQREVKVETVALPFVVAR